MEKILHDARYLNTGMMDSHGDVTSSVAWLDNYDPAQEVTVVELLRLTAVRVIHHFMGPVWPHCSLDPTPKKLKPLLGSRRFDRCEMEVSLIERPKEALKIRAPSMFSTYQDPYLTSDFVVLGDPLLKTLSSPISDGSRFSLE